MVYRDGMLIVIFDCLTSDRLYVYFREEGCLVRISE